MQIATVHSPLVKFTRGALGVGALCGAFGAVASGISAVAGHFLPDLSIAFNLGVGAAASGFVGGMLFLNLVIDGCPGYYDEDGCVQVAYRDLENHYFMLRSVATGVIGSTGLIGLAAYNFS